MQAIVDLPSKVGALWTSITGGERDPNTPISVVGASVIGGQAAERGLWEVFVTLLATLNFFLGAFNLLPLLPLDGGHIASALWEAVRRGVARLRRRPDPGYVDAAKLLPVAYVVASVMLVMGLVLIVGDLVAPVASPL